MRKILMFILILMLISIIACSKAVKKVEAPKVDTTKAKASVNTAEIDKITNDIASNDALVAIDDSDADLSGQVQD